MTLNYNLCVVSLHYYTFWGRIDGGSKLETADSQDLMSSLERLTGSKEKLLFSGNCCTGRTGKQYNHWKET